jgi:hypothetical protein
VRNGGYVRARQPQSDYAPRPASGLPQPGVAATVTGHGYARRHWCTAQMPMSAFDRYHRHDRHSRSVPALAIVKCAHLEGSCLGDPSLEDRITGMLSARRPYHPLSSGSHESRPAVTPKASSTYACCAAGSHPALLGRRARGRVLSPSPRRRSRTGNTGPGISQRLSSQGASDYARGLNASSGRTAQKIRGRRVLGRP